MKKLFTIFLLLTSQTYGWSLFPSLLPNSSMSPEDGKKMAEAFGKGIFTAAGDAIGGINSDSFGTLFNKGISGAGQAMGQNGKNSDFSTDLKTFLETFGEGGQFIMDQYIYPNMGKTVLISLGTAAVYFSLKHSIPLGMKMIERQLMRPKLIIESSQKSLSEKLSPFYSSKPEVSKMVFSPTLELQLNDLVKITQRINTRIKEGKTNVKYRNLLLYGPPGTGKTMFAKKLAKESGLEYGFMSGSSFSKFKEGDGIEALDELFAWAKKCKGLMIFIDEAETFLSKRENMDPQSKAYQLLNNFLNYTGQRSSNFMLVFASNHQDALDSAMYRRIDDLIEMPLPSKAERTKTLALYTNKILMDEKQNGKEFVKSVQNCLNAEAIERIAEQTKGLSYGDLEGIINTIKTDSDILDPAVVTDKLIDTVVERAIKKHDTFTAGKHLEHLED